MLAVWMLPRVPCTTTCGTSVEVTKVSAVNVTVALSSPTVALFGSKNSHTCRITPAANTGRWSGVSRVRLHT
ncbi:hypothetical protein DIPPA_17225 [Diplonema papillatum]|nr:hypothetical protein DIPPA_17225 [Diplonema papillatum]